MKEAPAKTHSKSEAVSVRKDGGSGAVVVGRNGERQAVSCKVKAVAGGILAPEALRYDAEDIEEANRIGAALCRQHAQ